MPSYSWTLTAPTAPTGPAGSAGFIFADEATLDAPDWGFDITTFPTLDMTWTPRRDAFALADALLRRLFTPRGRLWRFPTYGIDLRDYLNDDITRDTLSAIKSDVEGQLEQDERVAFVDARVSYDARDERVIVQLAVDSAVGPFSMTLSVTEVSTTILVEG
jgi:phage baseplate assembly protein W